MLAQRKLPLLLDGVAGLPAAAQHDLPKAVIELGQIGLNPNRFSDRGYVKGVGFVVRRGRGSLRSQAMLLHDGVRG